jgi:hypothetical protein
VARIELSAEVRAIESLIDAGEHSAASSRLQAAHTNLGRRPEYRYLVCLYDSTFHVRSDRDLLKEMIELVGEQPDLMEAAALLAQLYARNGDGVRADLFAHLALESANPAARARAEAVLKGRANDDDPPSSRVKQVDRPSTSSPAHPTMPAPYAPSPGASHSPYATPPPYATPAVPRSHPSSAPPPSVRPHRLAAPSVPPPRVSPSSAPPQRAATSSVPPPRGSSPSVPPPRGSSPSVPPARSSESEPPPSSRSMTSRFPSAPPAQERARPLDSPEDAAARAAWFERARGEVVHKRSETYGVRAGQSIVGMLLDWGKAVAEGNTFVSSEPMPLNRDSLALVDDAILSLRRQPGNRSASRTDTSRAMAAAGFFLAVAMHDFDVTVLEIAPDDGGCKLLLPSGAGVRPLLAAAAFADGNGPSLVHTYDRLAAARELASIGPSSIPAAGQPSLTPTSSPAAGRVELALTRPEVEATPIRPLEHPPHPSDPPPLTMAAVAGALTRSALSRDIAARTGSMLEPTPASIESLEAFCTATRGETGAAPDRSVWTTSDEDEGVILTWGALLGETLIAAYGGIWECDPNAPSDPRLFRVICEDRVVAWPMTQVYLRLKNGPRDSLVAFVAAVGKLLE